MSTALFVLMLFAVCAALERRGVKAFWRGIEPVSRIFVIASALFVGASLFTGCAAHRAASPKIHADIPHLGTLWHSGDAETPGAVNVERGETSLEIPAGTVVSIDAAGVATFTAAEPVAVRGVRFAASLHGPTAFPPPAPPSPVDEADGRARWFAWLAIAAGVAAGVFGLLKGWPMIGAGGGCIAAAGVAMFALAAIPAWVWTVGIVGVVLAAGGWALWTFYLRDKMGPAPSPALSA